MSIEERAKGVREGADRVVVGRHKQLLCVFSLGRVNTSNAKAEGSSMLKRESRELKEKGQGTERPCLKKKSQKIILFYFVIGTKFLIV